MNEGERCPFCFDGRIVRTLGPGRTVPDVLGSFEVPDTFPLFTCDKCGEIVVTIAEAKALADIKATARRLALMTEKAWR